MDRPEFRSPFKSGKEVGINIDAEAYRRQVQGVTRGAPDYVMSRSDLMLFMRNPANWLSGARGPETDATDWGSLMDTLVTEPQKFEQRYRVAPETCTATKTMAIVKRGEAREGDDIPWNPLCAEAKKWKEDTLEQGFVPLSHDDHLMSQIAMVRLSKDPVIGAYLAACDFQVMCVAEYHDRPTGLIVPVKVLIDLRPRKDVEDFGRSLGDFKTARDAEPTNWEWVVCKQRSYDVQAALCLDLYRCAHPDEDRIDFRHVIQENTAPFQPARRVLSEKVIDRGRDKYMAALTRYCQCLATGKWPSWDDEGLRNYKGWTITEVPEKLELYGG